MPPEIIELLDGAGHSAWLVGIFKELHAEVDGELADPPTSPDER